MGVPQSHPSHKTILELTPMMTWGSFMLRLTPIDIGQLIAWKGDVATQL